MLPLDAQESAPRICLGNTYRDKETKTVKVQAGEIATGADIVIPLSGLHTVAGTVTALVDGHALKNSSVLLLYADDREKAREMKTLEDGSFSFADLPEGSYILQVTGAQDAEQKSSDAGSGNAGSETPKVGTTRLYSDKELPITVQADINDVKIQLDAVPPEKFSAQ